MASPETAGNNLAELRKCAGYRSAREFAAVTGITYTTYARYERSPKAPNCTIPINAAWEIADKLHCSIDAVVGRVAMDGEDGSECVKPSGDLNAVYGSLSDSGRQMLDEYVKFLDFRDRILASKEV